MKTSIIYLVLICVVVVLMSGVMSTKVEQLTASLQEHNSNTLNYQMANFEQQ